MKVATEVIGIDLDAESIELAKLHLGMPGLFVGNVEHLEKILLDRTFDVILFGDLIEHLSCPGMAFDGIRRFMSINSEIDHLYAKRLFASGEHKIQSRALARG